MESVCNECKTRQVCQWIGTLVRENHVKCIVCDINPCRICGIKHTHWLPNLCSICDTNPDKDIILRKNSGDRKKTVEPFDQILL